MDELFSEVSCQRKRKANADHKLYPVIVTDVDNKTGRRVKIQFVAWDIAGTVRRVSAMRYVLMLTI